MHEESCNNNNISLKSLKALRENSAYRLSLTKEPENFDSKASTGAESFMTSPKLRRLAHQIKKAVVKKRREASAIKRETKATRLVAAIVSK